MTRFKRTRVDLHEFFAGGEHLAPIGWVCEEPFRPLAGIAAPLERAKRVENPIRPVNLARRLSASISVTNWLITPMTQRLGRIEAKANDLLHLGDVPHAMLILDRVMIEIIQRIFGRRALCIFWRLIVKIDGQLAAIFVRHAMKLPSIISPLALIFLLGA